MGCEAQNTTGCDIYLYASIRNVEDTYLHKLEDIVGDQYLRNPKMHYLIAVNDDEEFLGVLALDIKKDTAHMCEIFIEEPHRGNGIGTQLMSDFEDISTGKTKTLTVLSDNETAIRLYEALGYEMTNYPSANIRMEKD